ncbi:MAG: endonuclease/exonuclease/phosphatase family protein [Paracoccaceae bacterium]|nr:endonuclease/exonuclease/phosphatase family protein [Paracoccaceae bacterium]
MGRLRLASYNVHKCLGTDGRRAPGRVLDVVNALDADVVALQEVDRRLGPRPAALPRRLIEQQSDFVAVSDEGWGPSLGYHGNAVLLRRGIAAKEVHGMALPGLEPRGALLVEAAAGPFRAVAVHLGLRRSDRVLQIAAIRAALSARAEMPTVVLGDFNEWSLLKGLEGLGGYEVLAPGKSFHTLHPLGHLDRIALGHGLEAADAGVFDTALARRASDHLPVWAEVKRAA